MKPQLRELVLAHDHLADLDPARRRLALRSIVAVHVEETEVAATVAAIADEIDGYGVLHSLMTDPDVTDILVNGPHNVWVERAGELRPAGTAFDDEEELMSFVERMLGRAGTRVDAAQPVADARLPDGSRIHVVLPPITPRGPLMSIRRFTRGGRSLTELGEAGTFDAATEEGLRALVAARAIIAISGRTGSGKTTLLNALLSEVPADQRVVTIEETPELAPACEHVVGLVARPPNVEGRGRVSLEELVRAALRMRPDRIVVGEIRGAEVLVALSAMSSGHDGSMVTIHAGSARAAIDRMVTLGLEASGATEPSLRYRVEQAIDAVVHLDRRADGSRVVGELRMR